MNTRALTLALIISAIAMFMTMTYIDTKQAELIEKYGEPVAVVIATQDINELELIDDRKVTLTTVPKKFVMPGHFKEVKEVENTVATVPIKKGEQITQPRLTFPGQQTGLSRQVSVGKRAISIPVNESQSISKLIKPGDRVDVLVPIDYGAGRKDLSTIKTVLQDVLVLSTGQSVTNSLPLVGVKSEESRDAEAVRLLKLNTNIRYNSITLELDPYQVQKLTWAINFFNRAPSITLRNNNDKEQVRIAPTTIFDLLGEEASEAKAYFKKRYEEKGTQ
jgi:pilus assembly protein CpaB